MSERDTAARLDVRRVLRERARALARAPASEASAEDTVEVLEFALGEERYAAEARFVTSAEPLTSLARLPCVPAFVAGIVNVRGRMLPVLDLKRLFDLPEKGLTDLHVVIVVSAGDLEVGLLADVVKSVTRVAVAELQPSLPTLTAIGAEYLKGVTADRLIVLDLERMLADPRLIVNENVEDGGA